MKQKAVYPYDYTDSLGTSGDQQLPPKDEFDSILTDEGISDAQYQHAQNVWNTFDMRTMGEYHDLYLKSDILLLADVFENFRKTCLQYYKLDPCHYFTSPGLSWDAMLKMTGIKLELITDVDMFHFIEKGLRGGISYIANRQGKANNKYMSGYNPEKLSKYIMSGPYLGFFVCGGKLGFREISDQYSYKKQPSKIRHYVRKKTFSFPGGGNCPLRPPAMYGPVCI